MKKKYMIECSLCKSLYSIDYAYLGCNCQKAKDKPVAGKKIIGGGE